MESLLVPEAGMRFLAVFALFEDERLARHRFLQRGLLEPGRSLAEQAVDLRGLLNPGKKA